MKRTSTRAIFAGTAAALAAALLSGPLGAGAGAQPEANPQSNGFAITILDDLAAQRSEGNTSVTIGSDGRALISYYDAGNLDLKVAHCRNVICRAATTTVVDSEGDVGKWSAIAVGADVLGLISYYDATSGGLKVAHCQDATCSNATTATIDSEGGPPSIAIGTDGLGLVAYVAGGTVKVAHCATRTCSTATVTVIDVIQGVEAHASVAIGADGLALVSYIDRTEDGDFGLSVAHCTDVTCSTATTATPVSGFFERTASTAIAGDGLGLISVVDIDSNLYVVHCSNLACTDTTLASPGVSMIRASSITVGADGNGLISFVVGDAGFGGFPGLGVTHCQDVACTSATTSSVDPSASLEGLTSITVGVDGRPLISYYEQGDLKVAHCSDSACVPRR